MSAKTADFDADTLLIHAKDDHERLRTSVLRRLIRGVELLHEGMLAIQHNPPKAHIMADHADRVINDLRGLIESMQSDNV